MASRSARRASAATDHTSLHLPTVSALTRALRVAFVAMGVATTAALPSVALAQDAGAATARNFQVPAGPLASALAGFAADAGVSVSAPPELVRGIASPGLNGRFAVPDALTRLLDGTGLEAVPGGARAWVLRRRAPASVASNAAAAAGGTLAEVRVTATAFDDGTTEGTGSYGTRRSSTATRLGLSLRETPQSVSVITRQQMDDQALTNVPEILEKTPGVTVGRNDSERATFYARGYSIENFQFDGVPNTLNGSYQYTTAMADSAIFDRVEIVKGATGLLTGSGYPSATINLVRKKPTAEFAGAVSASAGSWEKYRAVGDVSGPLNESGSVRGRLVVAAQNAGSNLDYYGRNTRNVYGIVEADLTPRTLLSVGVDYMETSARGSTFGHIPLFYSDGTQTSFPRSFNPAARWAYWDNESTNTFATVKHDFGNGWKLDVAASQLEQSRDVLYGVGYSGTLNRTTGAGLRLLAGTIPSDSSTKAVNVALTGPFNLLGRTHELMLGAAWSRESRDAPGYTSSLTPIANYFAWNGDTVQPTFVKRNDRNTATTEKGISGAVRLRPTDALSVILGTRVSWYSLYEHATTLAGVDTVANDLNVSAKAVPYAGIVYDIDRQWSAYASYTDIFKPQTYYKDAGEAPVAPLTGKSAEIGLKAELLDKRLNVSAALFQIQQDNAAQFVGTSATTGLEIYKPVSGVKSRGIELEASGQITPGWNIAGGYTFNTSHLPPQPNLLLSAVNTNQPKHLFKLSTAYRLPGDWSRLVVGGSFSWQSETYYQTSDVNQWRYTQPSYALLGLMARYEFGRHLSVSLNINNVFDKTYMPGLGSYGTGVYGDPRNVLLTANYRF